MDFSKRLKELRESKDITQDELAGLLKVSRPTIAGYETKHRQPDYDKLVMLSDIFQVSIDYLLTGHDREERETLSPVHPNEKALDRKVIKAYRSLGFKEKEDVMEYIELLELRQKYSQESDS